VCAEGHWRSWVALTALVEYPFLSVLTPSPTDGSGIALGLSTRYVGL